MANCGQFFPPAPCRKKNPKIDSGFVNDSAIFFGFLVGNNSAIWHERKTTNTEQIQNIKLILVPPSVNSGYHGGMVGIKRSHGGIVGIKRSHVIRTVISYSLIRTKNHYCFTNCNKQLLKIIS